MQGGTPPEDRARFSKPWVLISFFVILAFEVVLWGGSRWLLEMVAPASIFRLRLESLFILASFFCGGYVIGLISPRVRVAEPAAGAFLAVLVTFFYALFTPSIFFKFSIPRILIGGGVAFVLALLGAELGEKTAARLGNRASRTYLKDK